MNHVVKMDAYIAIGSNLGDRLGYIESAIELLNQLEKIEVICVSTMIETAPIGPGDQGNYLNGAIQIRTELSARALLDELLKIELECGRMRSPDQQWGARTLDLDLLVYHDQVLDEPGLQVPHPRMHTRRFVLEPLCEIAPDLMIPSYKKTSRALLEMLEDSE